jgi:hypothetical protein
MKSLLGKHNNAHGDKQLCFSKSPVVVGFLHQVRHSRGILKKAHMGIYELDEYILYDSHFK